MAFLRRKLTQATDGYISLLYLWGTRRIKTSGQSGKLQTVDAAVKFQDENDAGLQSSKKPFAQGLFLEL